MEQCVFCQSVYELEESNSTIPTSLCSKECEDGFKEHEEELTSTIFLKKVKYKRYHFHGKGIPRTYDYSLGFVLKENTIHWKIKDVETGIEVWRIKDNVEVIKK